MNEAEKFKVIDGGLAQERRPDRASGTEANRCLDLRAEEAVLSNVMLDASLLDEVRVFLRAEQFASEAMRRTFEAVCGLRDASQPIDIVTVGTWLKDQGRIEQVGGMATLTEVLAAAPALGSAQVNAYARSVRDRWVRRELKRESMLATSRCDHDGVAIEHILAETRDRIDTLGGMLVDSERSSEVKPVLRRTIEQIERAAKTQGHGSRPTGYDRLDRVTAGLHSELVLLGARPGMGKTSLATSIAIHRAKAGEGVYVASLETNESELMSRILCCEGGIELQAMRTGLMNQTQWGKLSRAAETLAALPLWLDDQSSMTVSELWSKCRRVAMHLARDGRKMGLVVIDYVQLLRPARAAMKREEAIAENARMLKSMAQELDCPVLALAQLNRECEKRPDRRPQLADLRESGELEQCARTVLLLFREDYYRKPADRQQNDQVGEVHVAKQNNGPAGCMVRLHFDEQHVRFSNFEDWEAS